ncbi:MAG: hypothetical protein JWR16_1177 [Nevskia sp.]|nr:hypothetical protein [Nevskia sp.]
MPRITHSALFALALALPLAALAEPVASDHLEAELVAETSALAVDADNWLALRIKPEDGWHVYWRNPGDSGLPTGIDWQLPPDLSTGELQWPYPQLTRLGDIVNYGYGEETLLPVLLHVGSSTQGERFEIKGKAHWLVCKDVCIPGSAQLSLTLPRAQDDAPAIDPKWRDAFAKARKQLPQPAPADWSVHFAAQNDDFSLGISGAHLSAGGAIEFFPYASDLLNHSAPPRLANQAEHGLRLSQKLSDAFVKAPEQVDGVLVVHDGDATKAWELHATPGSVTPVPLSAARPTAIAMAEVPAPRGGLPLILLFAVLGGLILNLMPCVFPMLSIKAISVLEGRGKVPRVQRGHALAYTSGVMLTFAGLAGLLLLLRSSGEAVGWGFQLQQPAFVAGLAYLFFAMGLSMSGVVNFGTRLMGVGQSLTTDSGFRGSFFTGVLAVAVASPCTAPFMGTALGYALAQPAAIAIAVFLALGLGLALPFLLIGFFPRLGAFLPRPGAWMETFKQLMAFPLYLTVIGLLWVLGGLTDRDGMTIAMLGLTLIALALWLWHRQGWFATTIKAASVVLAIALLAAPQIRLHAAGSATDARAASAAAAHEPWSEQKVADLRAQGKTVFVNFTADWCITCKVNERVALASSAVTQAFAADDVTWLEGDWTRNDPAITQLLTQFGRSGVPLYLVYVKGGEPKVLPQLLTPGIVIDALK